MKEITLSKTAYYMTLNPLCNYYVNDGKIFLYAVRLDSQGEPGRRFFMCELHKGEMFPAMYIDSEILGNWTFMISAAGEGSIYENESYSEEIILKFAKEKLKICLFSSEEFAEEVVEKVNVILIKEEGGIYSATQEQEKSYEKSLTLIYNLFHRKKRISQADKSNYPIYDAVSFLCAKQNIHVASYDNLKDACGRKFTIQDIARVSHFTCRKIILEENWFNHDSGAFIAFTDEGKPVVCIPKGTSKYTIYYIGQNDSTGKTVTYKIAKELSPEAYMIYKPLPNKKLNAFDLIKFGCESICKSDILNVLLFSLLSTIIGLLVPYLNQKIFDDYINTGDTNALFETCMLILVFSVSNLSFIIVKNIALFRSTNTMEYTAQSAVFDRLYNMPSSFYHNYSSVDLAKRATGVGTIFNVISNTVVSTLLTAICSVMYLVRMVTYSGQLAIAGVGLVLLNMLIVGVIGTIQIKYEKQLIEINSKTSSVMYQLIGGISKIRIAGVENRALLQYLEPYGEFKKVTIKKEQLNNLAQNLNIVLSTLFNVVFYYIMVKKNLSISFGVFMGFMSAFGSFSAAMIQVVVAYLDVNHIIPLFERAKPLLENTQEFSEDCIMPGKIEGDIELSNVSFRYNADEPMVLNDVSLNIKSGEYVGIVGESGCGKSTLLKLLLGFEKPTLGKIYYDSKDIDSFDKRELRKRFGVVLQDSKLISGSIYENITITSGDLPVNMVNDVVKAVGLEKDIKQMPMQLHTVVSDGGGTISGSQRQRILIARAIVNKPNILFFDEATSALDNVNQALVCESLEKLKATRIVIAHRLSTIINCDRILVMANGKIVEQGTYDELMKLKGRFYQLAVRQST